MPLRHSTPTRRERCSYSSNLPVTNHSEGLFICHACRRPLSGKQAKHDAFVAEVEANEPRITKVKDTAEDLIDNNSYQSSAIQ